MRRVPTRLPELRRFIILSKFNMIEIHRKRSILSIVFGSLSGGLLENILFFADRTPKLRTHLPSLVFVFGGGGRGVTYSKLCIV